MRIFKTLCIILLSLTLAGCLYSFYPAYNPDDVIYQQDLLGNWQDQKQPEDQWSFQPYGENAYEVTIKNEGEELAFIGHLFTLGENQFLDFFPKKKEGTTFASELVAPYHMIVMMRKQGDGWQVVYLNYDWAQKMIEEKKFEGKYIKVDDGGTEVLTTSTEETRALLKEYVKDAFDTSDSVVKLIRQSQPL